MQGTALAGKKVLLTHSADGLGFVIAIAFAQAGAEVVLHDRSAAVVAAAVEHLSLAVPGSRVKGEDADLSTDAGVRQILAYAGPIDALVIDAHAVGVVNFSQLEELEAHQDRQALRDHSVSLSNDFVGNMKGENPKSIFVLSLTPTAAEKSSWLSASLSTSSVGAAAGLTVYTVSVRDLILAPVADIVKSEVVRTNATLADVIKYLLRDHRPAAIAVGLTAIQEVTERIIQLCTGQH
jgi:NAD(P)-dependent dehydrogenase (short-subunit alcohol dehydrogenase family)